MRGFLALRDQDGKLLAFGELRQTIHGNQVTARLTYRFKDGSIDEETTVYSQQSDFRLITDHRIQRGPSFPHPLDMTIDVASGTVTTHSDNHGKDQTESRHMDLPPDLANGLVVTLLKNLRPETDKLEVSLLSTEAKPRLTKAAILPDGEGSYVVAGTALKARKYLLKAELGPITKVAAAVLNKTPADGRAWISDGSPSTLLRAEYQLYGDGPVWRIELASPTWESADRETKKAASQK